MSFSTETRRSPCLFPPNRFSVSAVIMTGHRDESAAPFSFPFPFPPFSHFDCMGFKMPTAHLQGTATPINGCNSPSTIDHRPSCVPPHVRPSVHRRGRLPLHVAIAASGNIESHPPGYGALPDLREEVSLLMVFYKKPCSCIVRSYGEFLFG